MGLKRVLQTRDRLLEKVRKEISGPVIDREAMRGMIPLIASFLDCPLLSIKHYFSVFDEIASNSLWIHIWRLVGNQDYLKSGGILKPFDGRVVDDIGSVIVLSAHRIHDQVVLFVRFVEGLHCPAICPMKFSYRLLSVLTKRLGFTKNRPFRSVKDLVGLCFLMDIDGTEQRRLKFRKIFMRPWAETWNRDVLNLRFRIKSCPKGLLPCHECEFLMSECLGSVRYSHDREIVCCVCNRTSHVPAFLLTNPKWSCWCLKCILTKGGFSFFY